MKKLQKHQIRNLKNKKFKEKRFKNQNYFRKFNEKILKKQLGSNSNLNPQKSCKKPNKINSKHVRKLNYKKHSKNQQKIIKNANPNLNPRRSCTWTASAIWSTARS